MPNNKFGNSINKDVFMKEYKIFTQKEWFNGIYLFRDSFMKKIIFLFIILLSLSCLGCGTTNQTVIANSANLLDYNYATINNVIDYGGSAVLMDLEVRIYNRLV